MKKLLQDAFAKAAALPPDEQDILASRLLAELEPETQFDRKIADSVEKLAALATDALDEHHRGQTKPLNPDRV